MRFLLDDECKLCIGKDSTEDDFGTEEFLLIGGIIVLFNFNHAPILLEVE
jgi:hypothetical protein